jgi:uncharacterized protein (TIGR02246 family)
MTATDEIRDLLQTYAKAIRQSDAVAAAACYTRDGVFLPALAPASRGGDIPSVYQQLLAAVRLDFTFTFDEIVVASETVAYGLTHSNGRQTIVATGAESPEANREMWVFLREDGAWKIHRYMFNTER